MTSFSETDMIAIELLMDDKPEYFSGTPAEIVKAMNGTAFVPEPDTDAYMKRFQHYAKLVGGFHIRTETPALFVEDMVTHGLARTVERMH